MYVTLKDGRKIRMPSEEEDAVIRAGIAQDDDNPEWTEEDFAHARPAREVLSPALYIELTDKSRPTVIRHLTDAQDRARRVGRPRSDDPKSHMNMRVDTLILNRLRASGKGWQTRVNALLREAVEQGRI